MPGGFNITAVRKYLETRWGLGAGRQDGALLLALTAEPASRLGSDTDAKAYLDGIATQVSVFHHLVPVVIVVQVAVVA